MYILAEGIKGLKNKNLISEFEGSAPCEKLSKLVKQCKNTENRIENKNKISKLRWFSISHAGKFETK